jgi:hypothetical protein
MTGSTKARGMTATADISSVERMQELADSAPQPLDGADCAVCPHPVARHDSMGLRFCHAHPPGASLEAASAKPPEPTGSMCRRTVMNRLGSANKRTPTARSCATSTTLRPTTTACRPSPRPRNGNHLHRQVLTSRNVRGGRIVDLLLGGLNYQVEHHLFPGMPRPNLRRAQRPVAAFCAQRGVRYVETGLLDSYRQVLQHLHDIPQPATIPEGLPG